MQRLGWALILHGGARTIEPDDFALNREGLRVALDAAAAVLARSGSAIESVDAAVQALEDHPAFNAGRSCVLNRDGDMELDAAIMDGTTAEIGAVAALRNVRYPVTVAKALLRQNTVLLAGGGAEKFARSIGAEPMPPDVCKRVMREQAGHDTVGCIALDSAGNIAVATSTGGLQGKMPGRVGDAPLPGCGFFADSAVGGVAFSGEGEAVMRTILAARAMPEIAAAGPQRAMDRAIGRIGALQAEAGGIALDRQGCFGWAHNSAHFAVGMVREGEPAGIYLSQSEALSNAHAPR